MLGVRTHASPHQDWRGDELPMPHLDMGDGLTTFNPEPDMTPSKPAFQEADPDLSLVDYVGPESWVLFKLIGGDHGWLWQPPPWDGDPRFEAMKKVVTNIVGVNDPAERACGLAKRYKVSNFPIFLCVLPSL